MAALPYTKKLFVQRIRKHISNKRFSSDDFGVSDNEINLYIDQAIAARIVGKAYENAKVTGALAVDEAFLVTYSLATTQDAVTQEWVATLPQPPVGLPLGYSVNRVYFSTDGGYITLDAIPIEAKRTGYRDLLPMPSGIFYRVVNKELRLKAAEGENLYNYTVYVEMPSARTTDVDAVMNLPENEIQTVFDMVIKELAQRYGMPMDIIKDDLGAGNKNS